MKSTVLSALLLAAMAAAPVVAQPIPADVVTVGTVSGAAGGTVDVPVYIRDVSGSVLGIDQPPGSRIQSYGLTVNYSPAASVQSVTFTRGGITVPLTPTFESSPSSPGSITLIDTFQESTNLIPFVSNATPPGNQVGTLHVTISPSATIGSTITLALDPTLTQLSNQAGTTKETVALANLVLVSGAINVTSSIPALSPWLLALLAVSLAVVALPMLRRV